MKKLLLSTLATASLFSLNTHKLLDKQATPVTEETQEVQKNEESLELLTKELDLSFSTNIETFEENVFSITSIDEARSLSNKIEPQSRTGTIIDREGNIVPSELSLTKDFKFNYQGDEQILKVQYDLLNIMIDNGELFVDQNMNIITKDEIKARCWFWCKPKNRNRNDFQFKWYGIEKNFSSGYVMSFIESVGHLIDYYGVWGSLVHIMYYYSWTAPIIKAINIGILTIIGYGAVLGSIDHFNGSKVGTKVTIPWTMPVMIPSSQ